MKRYRSDPACSGCHKLMDPIGFTLESFDAIGGWRTHDNGNPVDMAEVMYDGTRIQGPADLRRFLLQYSDQFVRNLTENLLIYALGRGMEYYDMPVVRSIARDSGSDNYRFQSLITAIVMSDLFRNNSKAVTDNATVAGGG